MHRCSACSPGAGNWLISSISSLLELICYRLPHAGKFVVVLDDEDRENEGDLIINADKVTTEAMAFMVEHTSGVVRITELHCKQASPSAESSS